jgi:hypothetical protein
MIKTVWSAFISSTRQFLSGWHTIAIFLVVYAALLAVLYAFFSTGEATVLQLLLSLLLVVLALVLFFVIQAMAVGYTLSDMRPVALFGRSVRSFWKLVLISLPVVLLAALMAYLFSKIRFDVSTTQGTRSAPANRTSSQSAEWQAMAIVALQFLLFYIAFPLAAIHLWITTMQAGLSTAFMRTWRILARAFAPRSLLTYFIGILIFGGLPYLLISVRMPAKNAWVEIGLLGARLVLAFLLGLFGWVITLGALAVIAAKSDDQHD